MLKSYKIVLPTMGDANNSKYNVIRDDGTGKPAGIYMEDSQEVKQFHKNPSDTILDYERLMVYNPIKCHIYKEKIDVLKSILELVDDEDMIRINNSNLFVGFNNFISINDDSRQYPMMYLDESFIQFDNVSGTYFFCKTPKEMYDFYFSRFFETSYAASLSFLKSATKEQIDRYALSGEENFQMKTSVFLLLPLSKDVFLYPHLFPGEGVNKYYSYVMTMISYMFNVFTPSGILMNDSMYGINELRRDIVMAGFGVIGLIGKMYCSYVEYLRFLDFSRYHGVYKQFLDHRINSKLEEKQKINEIMEDLGVSNPILGTVQISKEVVFVSPCLKCIVHSAGLVDVCKFKSKNIGGIDRLTYGQVNVYGYDLDHAESILRTYMMDCPNIHIPEELDDIYTIDSDGRICGKQDIDNIRNELKNIYKKRRRIVNYSKYNFILNPLGKRVKKYLSVACHDKDGNDISYDDKLDGGKINILGGTSSPLFDGSNNGFDFEEYDEGESDVPLDYLSKVSEDNESHVHDLGDKFEPVPIKDVFDILDEYFPDMDGNVASSYLYIMSIKRILDSVMIKGKLNLSDICYLARGGFVELGDRPIDVVYLVKIGLLSYTASGKLVLKRGLRSIVNVVRRMLKNGELTMYRYQDDRHECQYVIRHIHEVGEIFTVAYF